MTEREWRTETRRLGDLVPRPDNPRKLSERQAAHLERSLRKFGYSQLIECNPDGTILDGHQRDALMAALERWGPDAEVEVRVCDPPMSQEDWQEYTVTRHEGARADWDWEALPEWAPEDKLAEWGFEAERLELAGFGNGDADELTVPVPIFSDEQIIDTAFAYFRKIGFPYRKLPMHVCMQEINKLRQVESGKLCNTTLGYQVADTYHPHRFHAVVEGMKSPFEAFGDDRLLRRALTKALQYDQMIGSDLPPKIHIVSGTQACSNFRPGFACYLYRKYANPGDTVLDCSTGYGGRLVGFIASGIAGRYIGIDPNKLAHDGNLKMVQDLGFADRTEFYNLPAEDVPREKLIGCCDFAFTSPPYFAKEHYSDDDTQSWVRYKSGEEWRQGFLAPFMALQFAALKAGKFAIVNIADVKLRGRVYPLEQWALLAGQEAGFHHITTDYYSLTNRFGAGQPDEVAREPIIIFSKPG